ncbi:family 43 glycosylhydrolase [Isoptericola sp. F-RaC21]|uniref:glycoside hydrolase family 43 protein n=1 Tax=Isoptericola sp. F-RaC21 TaxID=3141452 RepID=UPI00315C1A81
MDTGAVPHYRNPVVDADYSDPDVIRVGDEYWMVASSFNLAPGLPLLRSDDLVHWEHVVNARPALAPTDHFDVPRHGGGVWAPSLRHHDGAFHIVFPDPDHGIFVTSATDPRGEWSAPHRLLPGVGRIDPCPLWAPDGRTFLVHGWARSRAGFKNRLTVVEVSSDLRDVVGAPRDVLDGEQIEGFHTLEGPKFYARDGWYWIFAPAGGVATGWQTVFRSRSVWGPYEHRIVLAQGDTDVNGPHQGAWVDTPAGEDWFLHFQDRGPAGRVVHLQPMRWDDDGWPRMGAPGPGDGIGQPVVTHPVPAGGTRPGPARRLPYADDPFTGPLRPQWAWEANPADDWSEGPADGRLTLRAVPDDGGDLRTLGHVLGQRVPGQAATVEVTVDGSGLLGDGVAPDGARAGLVLLGREYAWIGVERTDGALRPVVRMSGAPGAQEIPVVVGDPVSEPLRLRVRIEGDPDSPLATLAWSTDGARWTATVDPIPLTVGHWVGARVGLFAAAPWGGPGDGTAVVGPLTVVVDDESSPGATREREAALTASQ